MSIHIDNTSFEFNSSTQPILTMQSSSSSLDFIGPSSTLPCYLDKFALIPSQLSEVNSSVSINLTSSSSFILNSSSETINNITFNNLSNANGQSGIVVLNLSHSSPSVSSWTALLNVSTTYGHIYVLDEIFIISGYNSIYYFVSNDDIFISSSTFSHIF